MKALVKTALGAGHLEVLDWDEPEAHMDQVKIQVKYAGICGSDLHTFEGHYKVAAPVILGHEFSGEVVAVGGNVQGIRVGDRVTAETTFTICGTCRYCKKQQYNLCPTRKGLGTQQDGAFAQYVVARQESVHLLPEHVDYLAASITEAAACAHHAVAKAAIGSGDIVAVLGPGPIGLLVAQVVKSRGAKIVMTGLTKDAGRLRQAKALGVDCVVDIQQQEIHSLVKELTGGYGADAVFECTGAPPSINLGLDLLKKQGQYVQVGIFPDDEVPVNFSRIIQKELCVVGSRSQNTHDWEPTLQLMNSGAINCRALISHQFGIDEWDLAYQAIKNGAAIKVALKPIG